jgi:hypothetical protein
MSLKIFFLFSLFLLEQSLVSSNPFVPVNSYERALSPSDEETNLRNYEAFLDLVHSK